MAANLSGGRDERPVVIALRPLFPGHEEPDEDGHEGQVQGVGPNFV